MAANHETGILQDISGAIQWSREHHALLHIDATQAAGRVPLELGEVSGVALSAHKLGGPSGVGALLLQHGEAFPALITGGSQERGRRAGTVNTAGVVGFGEACRIAKTRMADRQRRWSTFRDQMAKSVVGLGGTVIGDHVVQNTLCAVFGGLTAESIVQAMDLRGVCISAGAACSSGSLEVSPVLRAMGVDHPGSGVRFSFGDATSQTEVSEGIMILNQVVTALRAFDDEEWEAGV
jgi:cysteine desulfurase